MEKIKQNKLHTQTHHSLSRFKIFIHFYCISTPFILQTRTKTLKALYLIILNVILRATFKQYRTCLFNAIYIQGRKQPEDLAQHGPTTGPQMEFVRPAEQFCTQRQP